MTRRVLCTRPTGEASYLSSSVAAQLFEEMMNLPGWFGAGGLKENLEKRYKMQVNGMTGEDFVAAVAERAMSEDMERAAGGSLRTCTRPALDRPRLCMSIHPEEKSW